MRCKNLFQHSCWHYTSAVLFLPRGMSGRQPVVKPEYADLEGGFICPACITGHAPILKKASKEWGPTVYYEAPNKQFLPRPWKTHRTVNFDPTLDDVASWTEEELEKERNIKSNYLGAGI